MQKKFSTKLADETVALGSKLGKLLTGGGFIVLTGDLGGGKTQFTKGIAISLGITETVVSPTFTIERVYASPRHSREGGNLELHHFDLYRTSNDSEIASEINDLASDSKNIVVIEWPENITGILPPEYLSVNFNYISDDERELVFESIGEKYEQIVGAL